MIKINEIKSVSNNKDLQKELLNSGFIKKGYDYVWLHPRNRNNKNISLGEYKLIVSDDFRVKLLVLCETDIYKQHSSSIKKTIMEWKESKHSPDNNLFNNNDDLTNIISKLINDVILNYGNK